MNTLHRRTAGRASGFTLIEMLIVITIIAILLALLTVGVMNIFVRTAEVTARMEIGQLEQALNAAKGDLGQGNGVDFLPSYLKLSPTNNWGTTQLDNDSKAVLQKLFGRRINLSPNGGKVVLNWLGPNTPAVDSIILEGHELLVFYLGGIPNTVPNANTTTYTMTGFSNDPQDPTKQPSINAVTGKPDTRKGPYFPFKGDRLGYSKHSGFLYYIDPFYKNYDPGTANKTAIPYAYFSSGKVGNDYNPADCSDIPALSGGVPQPYYSGLTGNNVPQWINPKGFQIISAGPNKTFGQGGLWDPKGGSYGGAAGEDDIANFATRKLGAVGN